MARVDFGWNIDIDDFISRTVNALPKIDGIQRKVVLQDLYETEFNIYNHLRSGNRPLASVAYFECEDFTDNCQLPDMTTIYIDKDIGKLFNLSLLEFLELPSSVCDTLIKTSDDHRATKKHLMDDIESEFEKNMG